jgi:hypothetical protein
MPAETCMDGAPRRPADPPTATAQTSAYAMPRSRVRARCGSYEINGSARLISLPSLRLRDDCGMVLIEKSLFYPRPPSHNLASQDNEWPASSAIDVHSEMTHPVVARRQILYGHRLAVRGGDILPLG